MEKGKDIKIIDFGTTTTIGLQFELDEVSAEATLNSLNFVRIS